MSAIAGAGTAPLAPAVVPSEPVKSLILIAGALPPLESIGAVPVTPVTVPPPAAAEICEMVTFFISLPSLILIINESAPTNTSDFPSTCASIRLSVPDTIGDTVATPALVLEVKPVEPATLSMFPVPSNVIQAEPSL